MIVMAIFIVLVFTLWGIRNKPQGWKLRGMFGDKDNFRDGERDAERNTKR